MKVIKNNLIFTLFLLLGIVLCIPTYFASAEEEQNDVKVIRSGDLIINEKRDDSVRQDALNNDGENERGTTSTKDREDNIDRGTSTKDREDNNDKENATGTRHENNRENATNTRRDGNENSKGEEHRSAVATFVQNILSVADREKGDVGEQIKVIAKEQNDNKDDSADKIDKIEKRSNIKTFLIGSDYKNIGDLRSDLAKTQNHISQLTKLLSNTTDEANKVELRKQIQTLELERQKIDSFITTNENKFSLFGWVVKLFMK